MSRVLYLYGSVLFFISACANYHMAEKPTLVHFISMCSGLFFYLGSLNALSEKK